MMLNEGRHAGSFLVQEMPGFYSRDALTVALNQSLAAGQVVGKSAVAANVAAAAVADAGNTGNGVLTMDAAAPVSAGVKNGAYRAVCIAVAVNGGTFAIEDPTGAEIGKVAVGATFNKDVKFVIADGATDFVAGDAFTINVVREYGSDEEVKAFDPNAADGSQVAAAINFAPVVTDAVTRKKATFVTRNAEVRASDLTWPVGITAAQQAAAIEQLRGAGIILR